MFRLLMLKKPPGAMLRIVDIGPEESGKLPVEQKGSSCFWHGININPNVYSRDGVGIQDRQYYCVDASGDITLKLKFLSGSIFHEFTHCLHYMEDAVRCSIYCDENSLPKGNLWTDREERRTIAGYIEADAYETVDTFDPICDNCFYLYDSVVKSTQYCPAHPAIARPVLARKTRPVHPVVPKRPLYLQAAPYLPRVSHLDYKSSRLQENEDTIRDRLFQLYRTLDFNLAWPKRHVIA
jgi:hypothetical protein